MHIVNVHFWSSKDLPVEDLFGQTGVYVIWKAAAKKPSYIGEGEVLSRLVEHTSRFGATMTAHIALIEGPPKKRKQDAELVELTLLEIAGDLGLGPKHNLASGKMQRVVEKIGGGHNVLRVNITGRHPLRRKVELKRTAKIEWRFETRGGDASLELRQPWRRS